MKEFLFRGKRLDTNEWVYGFPYAIYAHLKIDGIETFDGERHPIKTGTICQYTGLRDINGVKIFEKDIVKTARKYEPVLYSESAAAYMPLMLDKKVEIIGNIYDDPELWREAITNSFGED